MGDSDDEHIVPDELGLSLLAVLWDEYRYRHDMIWKLVFRVTAVAAGLTVAPFLVDESTRALVSDWLIALPMLAMAVVLLGFSALPAEFDALDRVKHAYRCSQDRYYESKEWTPHRVGRGERRFPFRKRVYSFMALQLGGIVLFIVWYCANRDSLT